MLVCDTSRMSFSVSCQAPRYLPIGKSERLWLCRSLSDRLQRIPILLAVIASRICSSSLNSIELLREFARH